MEEIEELLRSMNPWWVNENWYKLDSEYSERVRKSPFERRWFRILNQAIKQISQGLGSWDVLILAGPRRTGKTSIMKKLVEYNSSIRKNFIYIVLDEYSIRKKVKEIGLRNILMKIRKELKLKEPLIIMIDEASTIEDWDLHVKNVIDFFVNEGIKFLLIITGSLGLRLIKGSTNILGRRGNIPILRNIQNPGLVLPYKFSEYAEAVPRVENAIRRYGLLKTTDRMRILLKLSDPAIMDADISKIKKVYNKFNDILSALFRIYLLSGGYPLIIYEMVIKNDLKTLDSKWYGEFSRAMLADLKYTSLRRDIAEYILDYLREINDMKPLINLDRLTNYIRARANLSKRDLTEHKVENYIDYFIGTYIMIKAVEITQINHFKINSKEKSHIQRRIKLFVTDPFIYHSIKFKDSLDPFKDSRKLLENATQTGILVEHITCAHLLRLPNPILYYHLQEREGQTIREIDCILHYMRKYIPIEVKFTENEKRIKEEADKTIQCLKNLNINSRLIMISKNIFVIEKDYVIIPAHIFLLLF
ncbi:MAG: AAA family ATPase [Candidatus Njordarchaeales archaeon]